MSLVSYGEVTLPLALNTEFTEEVVRDQESDTDRHLTRYAVSYQAVVNADYFSLLAPSTGLFLNPKNAADVMRVVETILMKDRQRLSVVMNGVELIPEPQPSNSGTVDAKNGPKVLRCRVQPLHNQSFLILWSVEAHYWKNYTFSENSPIAVQSDASPNVLYNRWTETVDIDNCMVSTRTRQGRYQIRSDNISGVTADEVRDDFAVVGVPTGFMRVGSSYTITPDGLGIMYRVVDREYFKTPPKPAFEAHGDYVETASRMAARRYGECHVRLRGAVDATSPQDQLIKAAVATANRKLAINGAQGLPNGRGFAIPESFSLRVGMYENDVDYTVRVMFTQGKERVEGINGIGGPRASTGNLTVTPLSNRERPDYYNRGSAGLLLQAAAHYDPSLGGVLADGRDFDAINTLTPGGHSQMSLGKVPGEVGKTGE